MPRVNVPEDFVSQRKLQDDIIKKVSADGASSPIKAFLISKGIVLADDAIAGGKADGQDAARLLNSKTSMNFIQLRDLDFNPVMEHMRGELQVVKLFVKPNYRELGLWGATVVAPAKIVYSSNFSDNTTLFDDIITQDATYPAGESPLVAYLIKQNISLTDDGTAVADAILNDGKAKTAELASQKNTQNRDGFWKDPLAHLHLICDYLMLLCKGNEKALGEYGITVVNSKKAPKMRTSTVKPLEHKTINAVHIGSIFTNTGTTDIHLYKGKTTLGTPTIIHAGEVFGMTKGYSVITVVNPSSLVAIKFTTTGSK